LSLTCFSLETYIYWLSPDSSNQFSHNWCRWKGFRLEWVSRIISTGLGHCGLRQLQNSSKILRNMIFCELFNKNNSKESLTDNYQSTFAFGPEIHKMFGLFVWKNANPNECVQTQHKQLPFMIIYILVIFTHTVFSLTRISQNAVDLFKKKAYRIILSKSQKEFCPKHCHALFTIPVQLNVLQTLPKIAKINDFHFCFYSFRDYFFRPQHSFFNTRKSRRILFFLNLSVKYVQYLRKLQIGFLDSVCLIFLRISVSSKFLFQEILKRSETTGKRHTSCVLP
jgi:hypothetical protein